MVIVGITSRVFAGMYSGGSGTAADPYRISTIADWQELTLPSSDWDKHFVLVNDIDFEGLHLNPVGNNNNFTGIFDGNNHLLHNAVITLPLGENIGLFGYVGSGGQIHELGVVNISVNGKTNVGGLVGRNNGNIIYCHTTGNAIGTLESVGGLVGNNNGNITACSSIMSIQGYRNVGGLVGYNDYDHHSITSCYSIGNVTGTQFVGGLVGNHVQGLISYCYSTGNVNGNTNVGGLVGWNNSNGRIIGSFWDIETSGLFNSAGGNGKTTKEMHTLSIFTDAGWDFVGEHANGLHDFWQIIGEDSPRLSITKWTLLGEGTSDRPYLISNPSELAHIWLRPDAYYSLNDDLDLSGMSWSMTIVPEFDGVFNGLSHSISNVIVNQPERDCTSIFGRVKASGQILNVGIKNAGIYGRDYIGGLAGINLGTISSCYVTGTISGAGENVGGLLGSNNGSVTFCYTDGEVSGNVYTGGLIGFSWNCRVLSCHSTSNVIGTSSAVGGLVGYNRKLHYTSHSEIISCYATGTVTGNGDYVGGLVGFNDGKIISSFASGNVIGMNRCVGGLAGMSGASDIISCYAKGDVAGDTNVGGLVGSHSYASTINSCYATGQIIGNSSVGGLVGRNDTSEVTFSYSIGCVEGVYFVGGLIGWNNTLDMVIASFWDLLTSCQSDSAGGMGVPTNQMHMLATYINAGWDFTNESTNGTTDIWRLCIDGTSYPRLAWEFGSDYSCPDRVSVEDLLYLSTHWLESDLDPCNSADRTGDGAVNLEEWGLLAQQWLSNQ